MRTKQEIEDRIKFLEEHMDGCLIDTNIEEMTTMIKELKWVLGKVW